MKNMEMSMRSRLKTGSHTHFFVAMYAIKNPVDLFRFMVHNNIVIRYAAV